MRYEIGRTYTFEVSDIGGDEEQFFRILVPGCGEVHLPKMKFQLDEPLPKILNCRVVKFINGAPVLSHYVPDYVNRFYKKAQIAGREFDFKVIGVPGKKLDRYVLEDKYGIRYNLFDTKAMLCEGQKVFCHFDKLTPNFFSLRLVDTNVLAPNFSPNDFFGKVCADRKSIPQVIEFFEKNCPEAFKEYEDSHPFWVITALKNALPKLAEAFVSFEFPKDSRFFHTLVDTMRRAGIFLLEDSRFLRNLEHIRRRSLQNILTEIIDSLAPIAEALDIVDNHKESDFVRKLKDKLSESGYLYHPAAQLSVLMMILRRNPAMVRGYLGSIFDTIMGWKLDTWTAEPFRSAFIDQFEIYIRQASREIDLFPQADTEADTDRIEKIITAIALQMLISGDPTGEQLRRNRSLFYRYISLQRPAKSDQLLDKSFRTLMGVKMPVEFNYDNIRQPQMLMTAATIAPSRGAVDIDSMHRYRNGMVEFTVSDDGCILRRLDDDQAGRVIPNGMMEWLDPQVYLKGVQSLNGNQINNFDAHKRLWANIETALFEQRAHREAQVREKRKAETDEEVLIVISPEQTERGDNPRWLARIDDENYLPDAGYIERMDIVSSYNLTSANLDRYRDLTYQAFVDEKGRPRHFLAKIKEIDADGQYHFSLQEDIASQLTELMNDYDIYSAVIAFAGDSVYGSIAETGYGVYLQRRQEDDYHVGDIVRFHVIDKSNPKYIQGVIDGYDESGAMVNKVAAFANLMQSISINPEADEDGGDDENLMIDAEESLDPADIVEIIELIRFKAISTSNLLNAFDYLHFGRLLAMTVGEERLARRLKVHAELLRLHQYYATNRRIDAEELEKFREDVEGYPLLEVVFHRLEIVSWLGDSDHNTDLWNTVTNQRNHLETTLAQLVLSYNMLPYSADDTTVAEGLKKQIAHTLGLNFEAHRLKSYGSENQFIEFKSSLVYPARSKKEKNDADPEAQQQVILKTIAAFLNSDGGTLYIGVNDKTHSEAGLFEDFEYYKHYRPFDGKNNHTIKNADNICVFLTNLVVNKWGNVVAGSVQIDVDSEASHDVIIVNVKPRTAPVDLDGVYYVRRSNNSMALRDRELADFIEERKMLGMRQREEFRVAMTQEQSEKPAPAPAAAAPSGKAEESAPTVEEASNKIATSSWRRNVLHSWDEGYVEPAGYFYFGPDNTFTRTVEDRSRDYDDDCRLALAFSSKEAEQGFLILVFDNMKILKVPMAEILEKEADRDISYYKDARLIFGVIALPGDALLTHLADSKGNLSRRVIPMAEIESLHLMSTPAPVATVPGVAAVERCELVAASALGAFAGSLA